LLLFEGGKSNSIDPVVSNTGVNGSKRVLNHLGMLKSNFKTSTPSKESVTITHSKWIRANVSGMFKSAVKPGSMVKYGDILGNITDPYGKINHAVKSSSTGFIINVNEAPLVYQGDALFHISTILL
jgi:predicted deacylase